MNKPASSSINRNAPPSPLPAGPGLRWLWIVTALLLCVLCVHVYQAISAGDAAMQGALLGGLGAAGATSLGTVPLLLSRSYSQRFTDTLLGFGAGVMLAASSFSLILPALNVASDQGSGPWGAGGLVGLGILAGAGALFLIDRLMPHEHFVKGVEGSRSRAMKRAWLFVMAIMLHNFPEGLAIGVAFAGPDSVGARSLAAGISIQDLPEGMVVALALHSVGYSKRLSAGIAILSGLIEPVAAVLGVIVLGLSAALLPWGLAAAAGAMLFVISHEIIPESHRQGHEAWATGGLMVGFVLMMVLDTALG
ncbi:ZIP family metal transporter [Pusillimonas caeni]|uniref:ZIP family metal transporter n=1 Tax=Pusillimonas caeni TaxID=1348472 RepID=UPI000E59AE7F|nr:ZIP family metal transporter [Pusillimonas caeni]TFL08471.1 ZIP family metal transporter [Pusillimonas caeni]